MREEGKYFFFEKKKQKTFDFTITPAARLRSWPMRPGLHQEQKSFGSFLQKRTTSLTRVCSPAFLNYRHGIIVLKPAANHIHE
jgi:hypothetical protein